ncbi:hypothetical protein ABPG72_018680 [Tetrahymena utriculariae]
MFAYIKYFIAQVYLQFIEIDNAQRNQYENQQNLYREVYERIIDQNNQEQFYDPNPERGRREGRSFFQKMNKRNNKQQVSLFGQAANGLKFVGKKIKESKEIIRALTPPIRSAIDNSKGIFQNITKEGLAKVVKAELNTIANMSKKQLFVSSLKSQFGVFQVCIHLGLSLFELFSICKDYYYNQKENDGALIETARIKLKYQLIALGIKIPATFVIQGGIIMLSTVIGSLICPGIGTIIGTLFGGILAYFVNNKISKEIDKYYHEKQMKALIQEAKRFFRLSQDSTQNDFIATHRRLRSIYHPDSQGLSEQQKIENRKTIIQIEFYYNILKNQYV